MKWEFLYVDQETSSLFKIWYDCGDILLYGGEGSQWVKIREFSWFLDQLNKNYLKKFFLKDDFQSEKLKGI